LSTAHQTYYRGNSKYSEFLSSQSDEWYEKYVHHVATLSAGGSFLDVGCGTGNAVALAAARGVRASGVDISDTSVAVGRSRGLDVREYDGRSLPFEAETFDVVGSFNVLEHTDQPARFLAECARVVKSGGHLIVVCPNFLAVTNGYHHHTSGLAQKLRNLASLAWKLAWPRVRFQKMETIDREPFQPDDDACNVTNPVDVIRWGRQNGFELEFWSSQPVHQDGLVGRLDRGPLRLLFGASFCVFRKR